MAISHGDLVLRTSPARRRQNLILALVGAVIFTAGATAAGGLPALLIMATISLLAIALLYGHLTRSRIVVRPAEISVIGLAFRRRRERSRAASVVRAVVIPMRGPPTDTVFVRDAEGKVIIRIYAHNYAPEDVDRLVERLGVPWNGPDGAVTAAQLAKTYPGIVPWIERRPFMFAFVVAGATVALIMVLAVLVGAGVL